MIDHPFAMFCGATMGYLLAKFFSYRIEKSGDERTRQEHRKYVENSIDGHYGGGLIPSHPENNEVIPSDHANP